METGNSQEGCVTCFGKGYYLCSKGEVTCHICGGTGKAMTSIVLATGCFDILTRGHIELLEFAALHGELHVGINDDESIKILKGERRPINKMEDRAYVLSALNAVHRVFPIHDITVTKAILKLRPDVWIKGSDYTLETLNQEERKAAEKIGTKIVFAPMLAGYSTTNVLSKI